jgi:hypothetical protein
MNTPASLSKDQALKKYDKATRLRWHSPISEWRDAFPTVESLAEFRRDVGDLSWPASYGQSPWDDAFSLAYNLGEGISESSRWFMLENADCDWGRQMLAVYAEYGIKVEPSPAPVVAPAEPAPSVESVQTSPEGVACVPALVKGEHYDVSCLTFTGWTFGDGTGHDGYRVEDYFRDGIYLGPDDHGIEPIADLSPAPSPAEPVKVLGGETESCPCCGLAAGMLACNCSPNEKRLSLSHAAHLAKIQALEKTNTALWNALNLMVYAHENADETGYVADVGFMDMDKLCESARAALALPAAPRSDS